jgi:micrococcal nuclease
MVRAPYTLSSICGSFHLILKACKNSLWLSYLGLFLPNCGFASKQATFSQLLEAFFGKEKQKPSQSQFKFVPGEIIPFEVETCTDGDTCRGRLLKSESNEIIRVRLVGIDAPEFSKGGMAEQPMALECKNTLNKLIKGEKVNLKIYELDVYRRALGEIFFEDKNINIQLLRVGCAEVYQGKPPKGLDDEPYLAAENSARGSRIGIWSSQKYESPKEYRKRARE